MKSQIENNFRYHPPKEGQPKIYTALRDKAKELALMIDEHDQMVEPRQRRQRQIALRAGKLGRKIRRIEQDQVPQRIDRVIDHVQPVRLADGVGPCGFEKNFFFSASITAAFSV